MAIVYRNKEYRNLQEQVLENAKNIEELMGRPLLEIEKVDELPETGEAGVLYLVPMNPDPDTEDSNGYDEYVWVNDAWELIGSTPVDISNMVTTDTDQEITGAKTFQDSVSLKSANGNYIANLKSDNNGVFYLTHRNIQTIRINQDTAYCKNLVGWSDSNYDLGANNNRWKDLYLTGQIQSPGTLGVFGYVGTNTTGFTLANGQIQANKDIVPTTTSYNLGTSTSRWNVIYANSLNLSTNATITNDSSNRLNLNNSGVVRIKVGGADSTYCAANWTPDQDATYNLGTNNLVWTTTYTNNIHPGRYALTIYGAGRPININNATMLRPSTNNSIDLGSSSLAWKDLYLKGNISDGTNSVAVADIATKPNYASPNVFASGTLDTNGEGTIDMTQTGMPEDGLYMFTYGNAQCFIALTSTMIQNAGTSPMRCPCPLLYNGTGYPGNLRIDRNADILTLKVAAPNVGVVQPDGFGWQLIKVM